VVDNIIIERAVFIENILGLYLTRNRIWVVPFVPNFYSTYPSLQKTQASDVIMRQDEDVVVFDTATTTTNDDYQEQANALYKGAALAPMVRASTTPLRALALQYGADFIYTEELVDRSVSETTRVENHELGTIDYVKDVSKLSAKTRKKLQQQNNRPCLIIRIDPSIETKKLVCQLGTGEPELALPAARHVYKDVAAIDINMGCPKKFSVSGGMGSALLKDPERACRILKSLRAEIPRPISCKIRLLETVGSTVEYIEAMMNAGANAVAIHARRVGHDTTLAADWDTLQEVMGLLRPKYPTFPFLLNGDFYERQERYDMVEKTKASGVLLGRPALYNTSIFRNMAEPLEDKTVVVQEYVKSAARYDMHYKNAKYVICEMMNNRRAPSHRVPYLPQKFPGGQTIATTCDCQSMEAMFKVWNVQWSSSPTTCKRSTMLPESSTTTLAPGEHKYADSYFLGPQKDKSEPDAKRMKIGIGQENHQVVNEEDKRGSEESASTADPKSSNKPTKDTKDTINYDEDKKVDD
jgi:tRNA-dihydrouridine synthase 2